MRRRARDAAGGQSEGVLTERGVKRTKAGKQQNVLTETGDGGGVAMTWKPEQIEGREPAQQSNE
jgi:hypothetical protein